MAGQGGESCCRAAALLVVAVWLARAVCGVEARARLRAAGDDVNCPPFTCRTPRRAFHTLTGADDIVVHCYKPGTLISIMCQTGIEEDNVQDLLVVCDINGTWDWPSACGIDVHSALIASIVTIAIVIVFFFLLYSIFSCKSNMKNSEKQEETTYLEFAKEVEEEPMWEGALHDRPLLH